MSKPGPLHVVPHERGCIRVFKLDLNDEDLQNLQFPKGERPSTGAAVAHMLGLDWLNPDYAEIFDVADLGELGLAGYLTQGNGVAISAIEADRARLDDIEGWVLILYSSAFEKEPAQLAPNRQLSLIGMWQETHAEVSFEPLHSDAAEGIITSSAPSQNSNPHLTVLLAVLGIPVVLLIVGSILFVVFR